MSDAFETRLEELGAHAMSRKGFIAGGAALVAAAGLGRFGATDAAAAPEAGELFYYNWASYVNPKTYPAFTKATGIKVKKDFYASNEALLAKLKGGARGYDLAVPTGYMVQILAQEKLLEPIDWSKLPMTRKTIDKKFRRLPFDPKDAYSVAKDWGTTGSCTAATSSRSGRRRGRSSSRSRRASTRARSPSSTGSPSASARCS